MKRLAVDICDISFPVNINRFANLHVTLQKKNVFFYRRHTNDACTIALINIVPLLNVIRFVTYFYRFFFLFSSFLSPPLSFDFSFQSSFHLASRSFWDVQVLFGNSRRSLDLPGSPCLFLSLLVSPSCSSLAPDSFSC